MDLNTDIFGYHEQVYNGAELPVKKPLAVYGVKGTSKIITKIILGKRHNTDESIMLATDYFTRFMILEGLLTYSGAIDIYGNFNSTKVLDVFLSWNAAEKKYKEFDFITPITLEKSKDYTIVLAAGNDGTGSLDNEHTAYINIFGYESSAGMPNLRIFVDG